MDMDMESTLHPFKTKAKVHVLRIRPITMISHSKGNYEGKVPQDAKRSVYNYYITKTYSELQILNYNYPEYKLSTEYNDKNNFTIIKLHADNDFTSKDFTNN